MLQSNRVIMKFSTILTLFIAVFLFLNQTDAAAEEIDAKTVAVLPFEMHAPSSLAYLQDGLRDMLASRIAANGGAKILERSRIDALLKEPGKVLQQKEAVELARQLAVDYVVTGSLTSLGGSMSLDARVFSRDDEQPLTFYASAPQEKEVIGAINSLSWDIAEKVFGAKRPAHTMKTTAAQPVAAAADDPMAAFKTEHPEKIYKTQGSVSGGGTGSPLIMTRSSVGGFKKTQNVNFALRSMDAGDIDGDGQLDVVMADTSTVYIYHLVNNKLAEFGSVKMPARSKIHAVSLADLNENGRAEIYISAADDHLPHSWAYEWSGAGLDMVLDDLPWYIRALDIPGEGPVLLGQRGGQDRLLRSGIFKLMKSGTKVMPEERIIMPDYSNLFEFALADVTGDGAREIVAISRANRLYVVRPNGSVLWISDDFYGGTSRYIGEDYELTGRAGLDLDSTPSSDVIGKEGSGKRKYIPSRMIAMDVNNDGITDVVVNKNLHFARWMENTKKVKSSEIHAMAWNGIALSPIWQTKKIDGYVPDFQLLPMPDRENRAKLLVGLALSTGWTDTFTEGESTILTYDIELAGEKTAAEETKD
ncbi:MAG: FG-GAP-like repeat-containing protein [Thermodesulfobacteriota bacterium]